MPVETGGRQDHVRRTRSPISSALGRSIAIRGGYTGFGTHRAHPRDRRTPAIACCWPAAAFFLASHLDHAFRRHAGGHRCHLARSIWCYRPSYPPDLRAVVGISLFFVSTGEPYAVARWCPSGCCCSGSGSPAMHYVGMQRAIR